MVHAFYLSWYLLPFRRLIATIFHTSLYHYNVFLFSLSGYLTTHYNVVSNSYLDGNDIIILQNMYPEDCAQTCITMTDFNCLSFDYHRETMECALSDMTNDMGSMLRGSSNSDYYQRCKNE